MRPLSAAHLTALDLAPPAFIQASAEAGFDAVGLRLIQVTPTTPGYALMDDPGMMRATKAALAATGLSVNDIEFVKITPELEPETLRPMLDAGAEIGARQLITSPYDDDLGRLSATLARLTDLAAERGIGTVLEFFPWTVVPDLATCLRVTEGTGANLLVDSLHFDRSDSSLDLLKGIAANRLPFAHLCDAPRHPPYSTEDLLQTARAERLAPGEGQIDLRAFVTALPPDLAMGLEVPMLAKAEAEGSAAVLKHVRRVTADWLAGARA